MKDNSISFDWREETGYYCADPVMMKLAKHAMGHRNFSVELSKDLKNTSVLISATLDNVERA